MRILARHPGGPQGGFGTHAAPADEVEFYDDRPEGYDDGDAAYDQYAYDDYHFDDYDSDEYVDDVDDGYDEDVGYGEHDDDGEPYQEESFLSWLVARGVAVVSPAIEQFESTALRWMARWSTVLAQLCLGFIYLWFGALKFFPELSPADGLVRATVAELSDLVGLPLPATPVIFLLATWEVTIGIGLLFDHYRRLAIWMLLAHLPATLLPFLLVPDIVWAQPPIGLTLEGQYIIKNLALLASASAVGAASRYNGDRQR